VVIVVFSKIARAGLPGGCVVSIYQKQLNPDQQSKGHIRGEQSPAETTWAAGRLLCLLTALSVAGGMSVGATGHGRCIRSRRD
jgi:hypothetical protein